MIQELNQKLKSKGYRHSKLRDSLLEVLIDSKSPVSAPDIQQLLAKQNISPNKTTIYRELELLKKEKFIQEIDLLDGKKRYEFIGGEHNHEHSHLICTECGNVECVDLDPQFNNLKEKVAEKKQFKVSKHVLQFFGVCAECS